MNVFHRQVRQGGKRLVPLLISFIVLLALLFVGFAPLMDGLTVRDGRTGKLLLALPIRQEETFSIRYIHSVNLSPVIDTLQWSGQDLVLRTTLFSDYGWGMPVLADGIGTHFEHTPDGFLISGIDKAQASVPILLQQVPDHHILYRGREISLLKLAGSGAFLRIAGERMNLLAFFTHSQA
ncbi:MAG: DUF1850 domain-containing protein [Clostridia bacterium]|nr:DUF1850 domain-containing protein [Clostridia bacterium]